MSFDAGETLTGKISPFETLIQVIAGKAEIVTDGQSRLLDSRESTIIPAHVRNVNRAHVRFQDDSILIKSGHEEVM